MYLKTPLENFKFAIFSIGVVHLATRTNSRIKAENDVIDIVTSRVWKIRHLERLGCSFV